MLGEKIWKKGLFWRETEAKRITKERGINEQGVQKKRKGEGTRVILQGNLIEDKGKNRGFLMKE